MATDNIFDEVFTELRKILLPYAKRMEVAQDTETVYMLNTHHVMPNKQPLYFGGVRRGRAYVSFHLMPVYASPELLKSMSGELRRRMQGKSCFNFKTVDKVLFRELKTLTKAGAARFNDEKFIEGLRGSPPPGSNESYSCSGVIAKVLPLPAWFQPSSSVRFDNPTSNRKSQTRAAFGA
jgi:hypothetical protein